MSGTQPAPDAFVYFSQGKATVFAKAAQAEVPQEAPPKAAQVVQAPEEVPQNAVAAGPMPPSTPPPWRLLPKSLQAGTVVPPPAKVGALDAQTMVPPAAPIVAAGPKTVPLPKPKHVPRVVYPPAHLHKPRVVPPRFPKAKDEPTSAAEVVKDESRFLFPTSKIGVAEEPPRKLAKFHKMMAVKKELEQVKFESLSKQKMKQQMRGWTRRRPRSSMRSPSSKVSWMPQKKKTSTWKISWIPQKKKSTWQISWIPTMRSRKAHVTRWKMSN